MPSIWFAMKKSLVCKLQSSDIHDPKKNVVNARTRRTKFGVSSDCSGSSSGCSGSVSHVREAILSRSTSKMDMQKPQQNGPKSPGNKELFNPIVHEVVHNNQTYELKISNGLGKFMGTLVPGTPGPGEHMLTPTGGGGSGNLNKSLRKSDSFKKILSSGVHRKRRGSRSESLNDISAFTCRKCGEKFVKLQDVEAHHLSEHAVTELVEGNSSRNIVHLICISGWLKSDNLSCGIERILKVHNLQKTISKFEEYRENVKIKASEVTKRHPRCVADGNELLRFHGTTTECFLGINGSSSLCSSNRCCACRILRHGFSFTKKKVDNCSGVFTASSSERALASFNKVDRDNINSRKALIVCRVIAGRVHRPSENIRESDNHLEFDSLASKVDPNSNIEELYSLNSKAILPCFVIICRP